jgi:AraC family transcriptional regulator of adaptative response/methylated-DNA-[protein]-cysteine methyltransferase
MTINRQPHPSQGTPSDAERWAKVVARDAAADGAFYYSVRTTGVYCRPSCTSRLPKRENVLFHATADAAERAGFRPCKRCRPNGPGLAERQATAVARACQVIETAEVLPNLDRLAAAAGMSRFHFHRVFKAQTGVTPKAYVDAHRARRLEGELKRSATVTEAIYGAGFNSSGRFYATSSDRLGMTPSAYRAGARGLSIRFAIGDCTLGKILVGATERGICAIAFADDRATLLRELERRFPHAELRGGDGEFERHVARVVAFIEAPERGLNLPLDVRGTAFQQLVWRTLRQIPPGTTASYAEIAARIGRPSATRAVARACASNAIAVAIPCHRVVGKDGGLSGYRWGVARKEALLAREARAGTAGKRSGARARAH